MTQIDLRSMFKPTRAQIYDRINPKKPPEKIWGHTKKESSKCLGFYRKFIHEKDAVAFCHRHNVYVLANNLKKHECLAKQCRHLEANPNSPFWAKRKARLDMKKENRRRRSEQIDELKEIGHTIKVLSTPPTKKVIVKIKRKA